MKVELTIAMLVELHIWNSGTDRKHCKRRAFIRSYYLRFLAISNLQQIKSCKALENTSLTRSQYIHTLGLACPTMHRHDYTA